MGALPLVFVLAIFLVGPSIAVLPGGPWAGTAPAPKADQLGSATAPDSGPVASVAMVPGSSPLAAPAPPRPLAGTPSPPPGAVIAQIGVGISPEGVAYDPADKEVYVTNLAQGTVSVIDGTTVVETIDVPTDPVGIAYDAADQEIYVASLVGNEISVISGGSVVDQIKVTNGPYGVGYDPATQVIYVANYYSANVSLISGTTLMSGAIALPTGSAPVAVAYDAASHDVYVSEYGIHAVAAISGSTVVAQIQVGTHPGLLSDDSSTSTLYCPNAGSLNVSLIKGTKVSSTLHTGLVSFGTAYDPANQYVYLVDNETDSVTVLNGTTTVGTIAVGSAPFTAAFDANSGLIDVADSSSDDVAAISTELLAGPLVATPIGNPANTSEIGASVTFSTNLSVNSTWSFTLSTIANPSSGLGCSTPTLSITGESGVASTICHPTVAGSYVLTLNVTATGRLTLLPTVNFAVFGAPAAHPPIANFGSRVGISQTDIGLLIGLNETPTGGSGSYTNFVWTGLPSGCLRPTTSNPLCRFPKTGPYSISVAFHDTDGGSATSTSLSFFVDSLPVASTPVGSRVSADVGQPVNFTTTASAGSGGYVFTWFGLPPSCGSPTNASITCAPAVPHTTLAVSVAVTDSNGGLSSTTSPAFVVTDPALTVTAPIASPTALSVGESFNVSVTVSGGTGMGTYNYSWRGLPSGCSELGTPTPFCRTTVDGSYNVYVLVSDENARSVSSSHVNITVSGTPLSTPSNTTGSNGILGLPTFTFVGLVVIVVVVVLAVVGLLMRRSSNGGGGEGEDESSGMTEEETAASGAEAEGSSAYGEEEPPEEAHEEEAPLEEPPLEEGVGEEELPPEEGTDAPIEDEEPYEPDIEEPQ